MKFTVQVEKVDNAGWKVSITPGADVPQPTRTLREVAGYPLPPENELAALAGKAYEPLCRTGNGLDSLYRNIADAQPGPGDIELLGGYLTATLLGEKNVTSLVAAAPPGAQPRDRIELCLDLESAGSKFNRLPWEMMFWKGTPLEARDAPAVAILRLVAIATPPQVPLPPIELPVRVLFVLGHRAQQTLMPGSEVLCLLRRLKMPLAGNLLNNQGQGLHLRLLLEGLPRLLEQNIREFQPQVIHFICHGTSEGEANYIILPHEETASKAERDAGDLWSAARLLTWIKNAYGGGVPNAVVLNACRTADAFRPFAAELVRGGVPMAIGMSGDVADGACRIFTGAFYEAIVKQKPPAQAAALGRRAALMHYGHYLQSVEWGRPTFFMATGFAPTFSVDAGRQNVAAFAAKIRKRKDQEMLCDRFEAIREYEALRHAVVNRDKRVVLAYEVSIASDRVFEQHGKGASYQLGKSRLLEELLPHAILDGFVPCLFGSYVVRPKATNLLAFAVDLAKDFNEVRDFFQCDKRKYTRVLRMIMHATNVLSANQPDPPDHPNLYDPQVRPAIEKWKNDGGIDYEMVRDLIRLEIEDLVTVVSEKTKANLHGCMILIDDLHLCDGFALDMLKHVSASGLGTPKAPAPLIVTYNNRQPIGADIQKHFKDNSASMHSQPLQAFEGLEADLA